MRLATLGVLILGVLGAGSSQQTAPPATPQETWPPPGVQPLKSRAGATAPRLLREVKPTYTEAAMRAKLEGTVVLQCVILTDGTVGAIHLETSLDPTYGLDEAAIAALKQWRFAPATLDGVAVPVIVSVELGFKLRFAPPELVWPDGFAPPANETAPSAKWHEDVTEIAGLRIRVAYPDGWTLRKNGGDNEIVELKQTGSLSRVSISRPTGVPYSVDRSVPAAQLRQWGDAIRDANKAHGLMLTPLGLGMASAASRTWAWYAYETSTLPLTNAPPAAAAVAQEMFGGARVWVFQATAGGHEVSVMCTAIVPRSGSEAQKASALAVQAADFGALIRHITIESFHD